MITLFVWGDRRGGKGEELGKAVGEGEYIVNVGDVGAYVKVLRVGTAFEGRGKRVKARRKKGRN